VDPEIRRAILSHADFTGVPHESLLEKTLFAEMKQRWSSGLAGTEAGASATG